MIGIDLGTTNSLVCVWEETGVRLLKNRFGSCLTPSVVSFDEDGGIYVGDTARERLVTHPAVTFKEFKREMGSANIYEAYGRRYTPEELSALVLKQLKEDAEFELGHPVEEAVISVPAYFNDKQRTATRNAGIMAGLRVDRLINEPSAAALAYHVDNYDEGEMFIVFDFGGGTLDVSLVDAFDNIIEIQAISGDNQLGGKDFNGVIAGDICARNGIKWASLSPQEQAILLREAERVKIGLSTEEQVSAQVRIKGKEYSYELDNQQLIDLSSDLFGRIQKVLSRMMNHAAVTVNDICKVILVGGSSKMPVVRQFVSKLFSGKISDSGSPDEIVCQGTGVLCGIRERRSEIKDIVLYDICPFTLGVEIVGDVMSPIIPRNQALPCSLVKTYVTVENNQEVLELPVFQGESHKASSNLLLARYEIKIPPKPKGEVKVEVRFSYDINGLFDIDIFCPATGERMHKELGSESGMSEKELQARRAELEKIKIHPREVEKYKNLLERAEAVYQECNAEQQVFLARAIERFVAVLDKQNLTAAERAGRMFQVQISMVENALFRFDTFNQQAWNRTFEDEEDEGDWDDEDGGEDV